MSRMSKGVPVGTLRMIFSAAFPASLKKQPQQDKYLLQEKNLRLQL